MKIDTIITIGDNPENQFYLADETVQNGIKYFLGTRVTNENKLVLESYIFEEYYIDEEPYLKEVEDSKIINYVAAIFTTNNVTEEEE